MDRIPALLSLSILSLCATACGEAGVYWDVKYSPGYSPAPTTVSVVGVYQDGRLSNELRDEVDRGLGPAFGQATCEIAWGDKLRAAEPDFYEEIDRTTQSDGITEDTLDRFSQWAEGDVLLMVSLNIRRAGTQQQNGSIGAMTAGGMGGSSFNRPGGGTGPMPGSRGRTGAPPPPSANRPGTWQGQQIRVSGILFSAKNHSSMGRITLNYLGSNIDEALRRFAKKVGEELHGSVCKGWKLAEPKAMF